MRRSIEIIRRYKTPFRRRINCENIERKTSEFRHEKSPRAKKKSTSIPSESFSETRKNTYKKRARDENAGNLICAFLLSKNRKRSTHREAPTEFHGLMMACVRGPEPAHRVC